MNVINTPWVQTVTLNPPTLQDNTADADRLISALKTRLETDTIDIDLDLLKQLPALLRKWAYQVRCIVFKDRQRWLLTGITDKANTDPVAGLAIDLGTTRVVIRLLDLVTGRSLAESAFDNPQDAVGPDILARIHYAEQDGGLERLNELIVNGLNRAIAGLCATVKIDPQSIYALAVAGNTTMTHLFMGLNPRWIVREPYIPAVNKPPRVKAAALGVGVNPLARVLIFPNIGSYFGGDLIAGILYSEMNKNEETAILVDVGSLIRSKAAMYTILETITASVGVTLRDLKRFYVAGTFGAFIDPRSAVTIGMLPDLPLDTYKPLGNSSLEGATLALRSLEHFDKIDDIRDRITYLELNVNQEFMNRFSAAKFLPNTDPSLFPSVKVWEKNK